VLVLPGARAARLNPREQTAVDLRDKRIVVGISGSIAAYKSVTLVRDLQRAGAEVEVMMTDTAIRFVGPATLEGIVGKRVIRSFWDEAGTESGEIHVRLGAWADCIVVAPASAHTLVQAAQGAADNVLLATLLCTEAPVVFAPAMHHRMWNHPAIQAAVTTLTARGAHVVGPEHGALASGDHGAGRMTEPVDLIHQLACLMAFHRDLEHKTVLVSAGPTVEDIDPVRFLSNRSSGKMGYAIAAEAARRGARVMLVSGPVSLPAPSGVQRIPVRSAIQMLEALEQRMHEADLVFMAAAVADFRPASGPHEQKLPKQHLGHSLSLIPNPDILRTLATTRGANRKPVLVGFALETTEPSALMQRAQAKRIEKGCDWMVANRAQDALQTDVTSATLLGEGREISYTSISKQELASQLLTEIMNVSSYTGS
jgi:phosphopantothenoylcysteine decarboxylase/phosphopantothenate--cysteine ligase